MEPPAIAEQIQRRRERAREESFKIQRQGARRVLTRFDVTSGSGRTYQVAIRSVDRRDNGSHADAFLPLVEALEKGLSALTSYHAAPTPELPPDQAAIERLLVRPGHLRPETSARIAWIRSLPREPDLLAPAFTAIEEILGEAGEALQPRA